MHHAGRDAIAFVFGPVANHCLGPRRLEVAVARDCTRLLELFMSQYLHAEDLRKEPQIGLDIRGAEHPMGRPTLRDQVLKALGLGFRPVQALRNSTGSDFLL